MTDDSIQIHFAVAQPYAGRQRRAFPFHRVHYRRPVQPPSRRQRLAVLAILFFNGMCLLGVGRWLYESGRLARAEENGRKYLQAAHFSPKFKHTSATKPEAKPASFKVPVKHSEPVRIEVPVADLPLVAIEPPPLGRVDPVDPLDADESILAYTSTLAPHQGDTPMLRNWKLFELAALLAMAAPSPIVLAGGGGASDTKDVLERLEKMVKEVKGRVGEVKTQVDTLSGSLGNVATQVADLKGEIVPLKDLRLKIDMLDKSFARLKTDLEDLRIAAKPAPALDKLSLEDLKDRLSNIEKALGRMQTESRTSLSPAAPATSVGKIMLVNTYPERLMFRINGREFFVQSGQSQVVEGVPAGSFSYQVMTPGFGLSETQTRTLEANRTFTLTAQLP